MGRSNERRVAIMYAGDRAARDQATPERSRFLPLFQAFAALGVRAECAVYNDAFREDVRRQLLALDGVLVWVNPLDGGNRVLLDAMLRDISAQGVFVSAHPDTILKMGTKEVLFQTRNMAWGCDTDVYCSLDELRRKLPFRLGRGGARVLKQHRGNGGDGVWKVEAAQQGAPASPEDMLVRVRHAKRGSIEETLRFGELAERCAGYFVGGGLIVDQEYVTRLPEGMTRCYLVHDKVAGFGHQAVNALCPPPPRASAGEAPQPTPRIYHPPTRAEFRTLKQRLEAQWVPQMQRLLGIATHELPILWDCDFLLGAKTATGDDSYVLCEINVSCVSPFPDAALPIVAQATLDRLR